MKRQKIMQLLLALTLAVFPTWLVRRLANLAGHRIQAGARIGFSLVLSRQLVMEAGSSIGHMSVVRVPRVLLRNRARIGHLNYCSGPFSIWLQKRAVIGNRNSITRAPKGVAFGSAQLRLGELSKITASHSVDCTSSVIFGDFTTLAGKGSQIWSHGYVHDGTGEGRYRVDGPVRFGDNVYVGSASVVSGGVTLGNQVIIGVGVSIAKSLPDPGMYVSSAIRALPRPADPATREDLTLVEHPDLIETVYVKTRARS